jgi:hypothetical protein
MSIVHSVPHASANPREEYAKFQIQIIGLEAWSAVSENNLDAKDCCCVLNAF